MNYQQCTEIRKKINNNHVETLLENLCRVNKQQGGTIHQFIDISDIYYEAFESNYYELVSCGIQFDTRKAFEKLANENSIKINWNQQESDIVCGMCYGRGFIDYPYEGKTPCPACQDET